MLVAEVLQAMRRGPLATDGDRVLIALSGGPDSTALLYALHAVRQRLHIELEAATVDHQLRPEAALECLTAMRLAGALGVPCTTLRVQVQPGASKQRHARNARYAALHSHAKARKCRVIAVGHTEDDQAETVLLRLLRGSGLRGLAGIQEMREASLTGSPCGEVVIRPLLHTTRADVEAYLSHLGITDVVRDPSNHDPHYTRVRVRNVLLPALAEEHPHVQRTLAHLAEEARGWMEFVRHEAAQTGLVACEVLPVLETMALHPTLRSEVIRLWAERVSESPLQRAHREALDACLAGKGEALLPGGRVVHRTHLGLVCERPRGPEEEDG